MIEFPTSTYYGKRMPKEKFYSHLEVSSALKRSFIDDVDSFIWRNKIASTTLNIDQGERVKEIALFEVTLKRQDYNKDIFELIDKNVPIYVIYVLRFEGKCRIFGSYKEPATNKQGAFRVIESFSSDWICDDDADLKIEGLTLDAVYENFIRQIAGTKLQISNNNDITYDIEVKRNREKVERQIAQLEAKRRKEKQFNRQLELSAEIKKLKKTL